MNAGEPLAWFLEIPPVSRAYLAASFLTTAACALEIISPLTLYFNYKLIFEKGQVWRLLTNFLFFGMFSLDFLFHMYFLVRYCSLLEENSFRGRTADFVVFIIFGMVCMTLVAPFVNVPFFGSSLTFMMVYLWGRRNEHVRMSFLGLFPFSAPYLPWVLFAFSLILGSSATLDLIGIAVGHIYFYFDDVYPSVATIRGWEPRHFLRYSDYFAPPEEELIQVDVRPFFDGRQQAPLQEPTVVQENNVQAREAPLLGEEDAVHMEAVGSEQHDYVNGESDYEEGDDDDDDDDDDDEEQSDNEPDQGVEEGGGLRQRVIM